MPLIDSQTARQQLRLNMQLSIAVAQPEPPRPHNCGVSIIRKIRKVGNSLMISLPPATVSEAGFKEGTAVVITARRGHVDLDRAGMPDKRLADFTSRFTERYRKDLAELADS